MLLGLLRLNRAVGEALSAVSGITVSYDRYRIQIEIAILTHP